MSILFPNPSFGIAALRLTPWTTNSNPFTDSGKIQFHIQLEFSLDAVTIPAYVCCHIARCDGARGTDTSRTAARPKEAEAEPEITAICHRINPQYMTI